jgi:hypothetical protein
MTKRSSAPARVLAVIALVLGFVILIAIVAAAVGGGGSGDTVGTGHQRSSTVSHGSHGSKKAPATYVVENGDTLTSIAHRTGVPIATILISGEKLKLR